MSTTKLFNILALSALAILLCSFAPSQTLALTVQGNHLARQLPNHHGVARKKRSKRGGQCKPRSSTSSPASTPASQPTNTPQGSPSPNSSPSLSSTQSPNPVATNTPPSTGGGKLGIAWALGEDPRFTLITAPGRVNRVFLWSYSVPQIVRSSGCYISIMLWDDSDGKVSEFKQNVVSGYANEIRGPNEVNEPTQANMSVDRAITLWRNVIAPYGSQGFDLAGPSTTSAPNGFDWMTEYYQKCPDCRGKTQPVHWYDVKFEDFKTYVEKWKGFGLPITITEFACQNFNGGAQPSMDEVWTFATQAVDYIKSDSFIVSGAPFGYMDDLYNVNYNNALFNGQGGLTDLGHFYAEHF